MVAHAGSASAAVSIGEREIVVVADGARAIVQRAPLRISYADASGRIALAGIADNGQAPLPDVPTLEPLPLGADGIARPALYAPLTFTVGAQASVGFPVYQWEGNLLTATQAGVQYSARGVLDARADGDGVRLTLGTSDPSGRTLVVTIAPAARGTIRLSARPQPADGVIAMADSFESPAEEAFRGFGGRHNAIDQRGNDFVNWTQQENVSAGSLSPVVEAAPGLGGDRYMFPNGPSAAYYVQSQFVSSRGYGFLLDRTELSRWRMASDRDDAWQVAVATPALDEVIVATTTPALAIGGLTALTGRQRVPPAWAVGPLFDRAVKFQGDPAPTYTEEVRADLRDIARFHLPLDGYRIEGWQFMAPADLRAVIAELHARHIHALLYFRAFVGQDAIGTDDPGQFDEAVNNAYVATTATGQPYLFFSNFAMLGALIDFTNPAAVKWWQGRIRAALDLGADGFMQDFGEQTLPDMQFANGETGASMHNRFGVLYHRATRELFDAYKREHPDRELFFFTRSGYSGTPGSAAYENANFPGDETTDWSRSAGLASQTPDMLNRGIGGLYGFTTDIGGFFDVGPYSPTTKELFLRWAEWAALSPLFRLHGSVGAGVHAPWTFDESTVAIYNALSTLHLRARPLILRLWREAMRTGIPVTRPLWLQAPGDADAAREDQEWMLGPDVLVAPVVQAAATARYVVFPAGCWQHPETGARFNGPAKASVAVPLDQLAYFFRCGKSPFSATTAGAAKLPRACIRRGRLVLRLRAPHGRGRLVLARIYVDGRRVKTVRGRALRRPVRLRNLPRKRIRLRVVSRTDRGSTLTSSRALLPCAAAPRRR